MDEAEAEKQQVEWVFGLTGGELADEPWVTAKGEDEPDTAHPVVSFRYWYEGVPDYSKDTFDDWATEQYRTVVKDCSCLVPLPRTLISAEGKWELKATFTSSGETECPGRQDDEGPLVKMEQCPLCDTDVGEEHGFIYLGDGWVEGIYQLDTSQEGIE